jgi:hypothetical protein
MLTRMVVPRGGHSGDPWIRPFNRAEPGTSFIGIFSVSVNSVTRL